MMSKLKPYTILNGKYIIENFVDEKDNEIIYKATDLVMREDVIIHEFFPCDLADRLSDNGELIIKNNTQNKFFDKLSEFEKDIAIKVQHSSEENIKNYFRENNTGYLVVTENKKTSRKKKLITRVILGILVITIVIESGMILYKGNENDNSFGDRKNTIDSFMDDTDESTEKINVEGKIFDNNIVEHEIVTKKQYSATELLAIIHEKSGYELFGSAIGKNDKRLFDWNDMYGPYYYEVITDEYNGFSQRFFVAPSPGYDAYLYDDFDNDGEKELFALMRNLNKDYDISLWFSNGMDTYRMKTTTEYDYNDWDNDECNSYISCKGLRIIQYGNNKHVIIDYGVEYNEPGGSYEDLGSDIYCIDQGVVTNVSDLKSGIVVEVGVDNYIVASNMNDNKNFGEYTATYAYKIISYRGELEEYKNIDLNMQNKTDVYYLNGKYNEYLAHKVSEDELVSINNYDESINNLKEVINDLYFSPVKQTYGVGDGSEPYDMSIESVYISENDKLYVNCNIDCYTDGWKNIVRDEWNRFGISEQTVQVNAVFSINNNKMRFITMYPGFREETSGVFE